MLHAAAALGLADLVAGGPRGVVELAAATGVREEPLGRLLRALASFGWFERRPDGRYAQSRLSATLRAGATGSMRELALFVGAPYHLRAWDGFLDGLRSGGTAFVEAHGAPLFDYLAAHPIDAAHFDGAMVSLTQLDAPALAAAWRFGALPDGATVCDVGGGCGTLLAEILARHPSLAGVLFDDAKVAPRAAAFLAARGLAGRTRLAAGSFFDAVPAGCDVYLLKDILHDWDDERALAILRTVRAAMKPGARLLVAEMLVDGGGERDFGALLDLEMMAIPGGRQRSEDELSSLLARAGLRFERVVPAACPASWVEAAPA